MVLLLDEWQSRGVAFVTIVGYDAFGAMASSRSAVGGTAQRSVTYTRDALGRIQEKTETVLGITHTDVYGHDAAGRLTTVARDGVPLVAYTYDGDGNRLTETTSAGTVASTYDAQDRLITSGGASYVYTATGELRTRTDANGTTTYTYDALGNLKGVALPSGTLVTYSIDGGIGASAGSSMVRRRTRSCIKGSCGRSRRSMHRVRS